MFLLETGWQNQDIDEGSVGPGTETQYGDAPEKGW
jgi:hypothetical protein